MQRNDENGEAKEFKIVSLSLGKHVEVPSGWGHSLVNTGSSVLVTLDNSPSGSANHDYESVKRKRGFAYYIVEKKGEIAFELNSNYQVHPQISTE